MSPKEKNPKRVREQVVVYMDPSDRELLEDVVRKSGLSKTEVFRRGLRQIAGELLTEGKPGSAFEYLMATATDADSPRDMSERHDEYLSEALLGKSGARRKVAERGKRARLR